MMRHHGKLGFATKGDGVVVAWRGRELGFGEPGRLPPYFGLHYELLALDDGKLSPDSPRGRALKEFLGPDYRRAVRDPSRWIREHLPAGIEPWYLRVEGETDAEYANRVLGPILGLRFLNP